MGQAHQGEGARQVHVPDGQVVQQTQSSLLVNGSCTDEGRSQAVLYRALDGFDAVELLHGHPPLVRAGGRFDALEIVNAASAWNTCTM